MRRLGLLIAVIVTTISLTAAGILQCAEPEKAPPAREHDFAGKILCVSIKGSSEYGARLEKAQVKNLGNKWYLVGTGVDDGEPDNWVKGRTMWISLDTVDQIVEFSSVEDYKKSASEFKKSSGPLKQ
jgi:hypothetical protein